MDKIRPELKPGNLVCFKPTIEMHFVPHVVLICEHSFDCPMITENSPPILYLGYEIAYEPVIDETYYKFKFLHNEKIYYLELPALLGNLDGKNVRVTQDNINLLFKTIE